MALPDRKPNRLKNFNYSSAGAYFITICIAGRAKILCDIVGGGDLDAPEVHLTDEGQIILKYIIGFEKVKGAHIDNFVIMPNHIHMIIRIDETDISSTRANEKIPRMVAAFKRFCNAEIGRDIFQRTYFDRVIRDEHDYEMIWEYIETNPAKWENDCFINSYIFRAADGGAMRRVAAPYKVQIIRHRSHKSSRLNAALAGLVDGRAVMGTFVCDRMNLS